MKKAENILQDKCKTNPEFLCLSGSRLYGSDTPESDYDYRGFVIPPFEYLIGYNKFKCFTESENDLKIHSLYEFLNLSLKGDPQSSEMFFVTEEHVLKSTSIAQDILNLRDDVISNKICRRILGYSRKEWRTAMAVKAVPKKKDKSIEDTLSKLYNLLPDLDKTSKEEIKHIINNQQEYELVSSLQGLGKKRKEQVVEYGYCVNSASHAIRLLEQLEELVLTKNITFPRPNATFLRDIKLGEISKEDVGKYYESALSKTEKAVGSSILPDKPNIKKVRDAYMQIVGNSLINDKRLNNFLNNVL